MLLATAPDDAELAAQIAVLRAEHLLMADMWLKLRELLLMVQEGRAADLLADDLANRFADMYQRHAAGEEAGVFAAAQRLLTPQQLAQLGASMTARRSVS